jgi:LacI family transcriptional regulator
MNAWPPLTTVDMNLVEIGRQAGLELKRRMQGEPGEPGTRVLPVRLVPRESTAVL